jgi:hypothetical protein
MKSIQIKNFWRIFREKTFLNFSMRNEIFYKKNFHNNYLLDFIMTNVTNEIQEISVRADFGEWDDIIYDSYVPYLASNLQNNGVRAFDVEKFECKLNKLVANLMRKNEESENFTGKVKVFSRDEKIGTIYLENGKINDYKNNCGFRGDTPMSNSFSVHFRNGKIYRTKSEDFASISLNHDANVLNIYCDEDGPFKFTFDR